MKKNTIKNFALFATACFLTASVHAEEINAGVNWEAIDLGTSNETNQFTVTVVADGNDWLYSWTKTGDLDGLGLADDTLSFDLRSSAFTGSSYSAETGDVTLGTAFDYSVGGTVTTPVDQHFGPDYDIDTDQSFQLSIENISFTQGEALGWGASFAGFTAMGIYSDPAGTETFYIGTLGAETITPAASGLTFSSAQQVLTVTSVQNSKRIRDIDFAFTIAIPESSSYALLAGLTGLAFVMVRRRRA